MSKTKVGIIGANGYGGGEAARLLSSHPEVELLGFSSRQFEGQPFNRCWSNSTLETLFEDLDTVIEKSDFVFLALPNGLAMDLVPKVLAAGKKVIDFSGDFRLPAAEYERWYGKLHSNPDLIAQAVYGLPELTRAQIKTSNLTANPGCFVTAAAIAMMPLAKAGLISGSVIVDGVTGISGGGRNSEAFSFAEANENVKAYKVGGTHQHTPEMEANLERAGQKTTVTFTPRVAPFTRGILVNCYVTPAQATSQAQLEALYRDAFAYEPFVHFSSDLPTPKAVAGSNRCDVTVKYDARANRIIAFGAIDNLVKGMAGEAIQNMNLMLGLPEEMGLPRWGIWP